MNTAAKRQLLRAWGAGRTAQRWWRQVSLAADGLHDPELLEHTAIAAVAIQHALDRLDELDGDSNDLKEVAVGG